MLNILFVVGFAITPLGCGGGRSAGAVEYAASVHGCPEKRVHILDAKENDEVAAFWLDICGKHRRVAHLYDKARKGAKHYWTDVTPPLVRAFGSDKSREEQERRGRIDEQIDELADRTITTLSYLASDADVYVQVVADSKYPGSYSLRYASAAIEREFARFRSCKSFHAKADDIRWSSSRPDYDGQRRNDIMFELIGVGVRDDQLRALVRAKDARIRFCDTTFSFEPLQRAKLSEFLQRVGDRDEPVATRANQPAHETQQPVQEPEQTVLPKNVGVEPLDGLGVFRFEMSVREAQAVCKGSRVAKRTGEKVHLLCPDARISGTINWDGAAAVFERGKLVEISFGWAAKNKAIANTEGVKLYGRVLRTFTARLAEPTSQKMECESGAQRQGECPSLTTIEATWREPNEVSLKLGEVSSGVFGIRLTVRAVTAKF